MTTRKTGTIARLFRDKVYGFIHCPADARDYFFHQAGLSNCTFGQLTEGDILDFIVGSSSDGRSEAQDINLLQHDPPPGKETREQVGLPRYRPVPRHERRRR